MTTSTTTTNYFEHYAPEGYNSERKNARPYTTRATMTTATTTAETKCSSYDYDDDETTRRRYDETTRR